MTFPSQIEYKIIDQSAHMPKENVKHIALHHFASVPDGLQLSGLSKISKHRVYGNKDPDVQVSYDGGEFEDHYASYHYVIDKDSNGKFRYTKSFPTDVCSGHDGFFDDSKYICNTISISIAGDYRDTDYEPELQSIIEELVGNLDQHYPIESVFGHGEVDATACPGKGWNKTFKDTLNSIASKDNHPTPQDTPKQATSNTVTADVSRYVKTGPNDPWYFRDPFGNWKGNKGYYPTTSANRAAAYQKDFFINCQGSCDYGAEGTKTIPGYTAACDPKYKFGTKFIIQGKTFECTDRGGAIKDAKRGGDVAIDIMVPKNEWDNYQSFTGKQTIQIIYP